MPLFVDKEENGGEAGDEKSRYDGKYDGQVERSIIISCERKQNIIQTAQAVEWTVFLYMGG